MIIYKWLRLFYLNQLLIYAIFIINVKNRPNLYITNMCLTTSLPYLLVILTIKDILTVYVLYVPLDKNDIQSDDLSIIIFMK